DGVAAAAYARCGRRRSCNRSAGRRLYRCLHVERRHTRFAEPARQLAFDNLAITALGRIELSEQPDGPRAQSRRHLLEIGGCDLSHGVVELELFDGAEDEILFALE